LEWYKIEYCKMKLIFTQSINNTSTKTVTIFIVTAFLLLLILKTSTAQEILSYSVIPSTPTENDVVYLDLSTEFSYGSCDLDFYNVSYSGNTVNFSAYYQMGGFTYICDRTDRFRLGSQFNCGQYALNINTYLWNSQYNYSDYANTTFNVSCSQATL